jgi:hypothetical protein
MYRKESGYCISDDEEEGTSMVGMQKEASNLDFWQPVCGCKSLILLK